jgi:hypothetical protein
MKMPKLVKHGSLCPYLYFEFCEPCRAASLSIVLKQFPTPPCVGGFGVRGLSALQLSTARLLNNLTRNSRDSISAFD